MTDALDEAFAKDLHKLAMPSELAINAAKVKAAQTDKKGAEKPDLYAKGKGKGKDGKPAKDEENDERKSKGPNKGDKKDPNAEDKRQGARSRDDMDKEAKGKGLSKGLKKARSAFERDLHGLIDTSHRIGRRQGRRQGAVVGTAAGVGGTLAAQKMSKKSSLDDEFNGHMAQIVGLDVPEAHPDFERPNVKIAGQAEDAIDMHLIGWMQDKADEDVVVLSKEAGTRDVLREVAGSGNVDKARKLLKKKLTKAVGAGAAGGAVVGGAAGYAAGKKTEKKAELDKDAMCGADHSKLGKGEKCEKCGKGYHKMPDGSKMKDSDHKKTAGVIENPENLDLLARIRKKAGGGLVVGSGDV